MKREELLHRLTGQPTVTAETCFVLLWTYLNQAHVAAGENLARSQGVHPFRITPAMPISGTLRERMAAAIQEVQTLESEPFDLYCLRWLKALDLLLNERHGGRLGEAWIQGLDGIDYRVRRRNHFLADSFEARVTSEEDQSGTRDLYTPHHVAVPRSVEDIAIDCHPQDSWGEPRLHRRLSMERTRFRVMLWPLQTILDYPALDDFGAPPYPSDFISLDQLRNEETLQDEVRTALATARKEAVSLLVFPELSMPPATQEEIRRLLRSHGPDGYPLLTLLGCCHCKAPEGGDLNEAVLLGPDGTELHRHQKTACFTYIVSRDRTLVVGEQLRVALKISVLECVLGNLTPLICLDLIHKPRYTVLTQSHANLLAVPSLSDTTAAHRTAATNLQVDNRASSFVSNRSVLGLTAEATSFFRVPAKGGEHTHLPRRGSAPYLLFSLEDWLTSRQDK